MSEKEEEEEGESAFEMRPNPMSGDARNEPISRLGDGRKEGRRGIADHIIHSERRDKERVDGVIGAGKEERGQSRGWMHKSLCVISISAGSSA